MGVSAEFTSMLRRRVSLFEAAAQSEKAAAWKKQLAEFDQAGATRKIAAPKPWPYWSDGICVYENFLKNRPKRLEKTIPVQFTIGASRDARVPPVNHCRAVVRSDEAQAVHHQARDGTRAVDQ